MSDIFSPENPAVYEVMWKNLVYPARLVCAHLPENMVSQQEVRSAK